MTSEEIYHRIKALKVLYRFSRAEEHRAFYLENKKRFVFLDLLIALAFIMNLGALTLTNAMVVKGTPNITFYEANPVTANKFGYAQLKDENLTIMKGMMLHMLWWGFVLSYYITQRTRVRNNYEYWQLAFIGFLMVLVLGWDFFNDFGYFIGVK